MTHPDAPRAFEEKYQRSAEDPASADMLSIWNDAWDAATERAAKEVEALRDEHCKSTKLSASKSDWCEPDDKACEFVVAWNDAATAIRSSGRGG